jgi:hypothetical protein
MTPNSNLSDMLNKIIITMKLLDTWLKQSFSPAKSVNMSTENCVLCIPVVLLIYILFSWHSDPRSVNTLHSEESFSITVFQDIRES